MTIRTAKITSMLRGIMNYFSRLQFDSFAKAYLSPNYYYNLYELPFPEI